MGCSASTSTSQASPYSTKPQAAVKPYPQQGHGQPQRATPYNPEPSVQTHSQPHTNPPQQQPQQHSTANNRGFTHDYNDEQTEIAIRSIDTTKELLQQYIDIDNQVRVLEAKYTLKRFTELNTENAVLKDEVENLEKVYKDAKEKTAKEKGDYDDLFTVWSTSQNADQSEESDPELAREKREWIEAKGEEEVARQELEAVKQKLAKSEADLKAVSPHFEELQRKHKEQEELLAAIFKGNYGSDHENKLEAEFDFLDDRKQRVGAARYKWTNGRNLLNHATAQLCLACKKWMSLLNMNPQDQQGRYMVATEARNNIIAAAQNMTSAKRYLNTIEFPYCKPAEVKVLETAAGHIYTDMQNVQRHRYVYANTYYNMYQRCRELVKWFTHVLTGTIAEDLKAATAEANAKAQQLRQERLNLISIKIKEELQQDVQFEARDVEVEEKEEEPAAEDDAKAFEVEGGSTDNTDGEEPPESEMEAETPFNPVPLNELVQAPNKEDLFGDAQELYQRHQQNLQELEKNQMLNKARQEQGLEEKLKARRSKRQREAAIAAEQDMQKAAQ